MRKKLLSISVTIIVAMLLVIPFATPVMANSNVILTSISTLSGKNASVNGYFDYFVTFSGTFTHSPISVTFYKNGVADPLVTADSFGNITTSSFTATLHVVSPAAHGPRSATVTTSDGTSAVLYSAWLVGEFPYPTTAFGAGLIFSITPCYDSAGTLPITTPVSDNTTIWYKITLSQEDTRKYDFMGGQIAIRFPNGAAYIPVAGYGDLTGAYPDVPEVKPGSPFITMAPIGYVAKLADRNASGFLIAEADYGYTDNPGQINGTIETYGAPSLSASITNALNMAVPTPPVPELPAGLLFGLGLLGIGGFVIVKRQIRAATGK